MSIPLDELRRTSWLSCLMRWDAILLGMSAEIVDLLRPDLADENGLQRVEMIRRVGMLAGKVLLDEPTAQVVAELAELMPTAEEVARWSKTL